MSMSTSRPARSGWGPSTVRTARSGWGLLAAPVRDWFAASTWLGLLHLLLDVVVGVGSAAVVGVGLALSVVLLPVLAPSLPVSDGFLLGVPVGGGLTRGLLAALGVLVLLAVPALVRVLVRFDVALSRALLVPGTDTAQRVGELERSRARVVDAAEAERRRIERDLHDGTQQHLVSLAMTLGRARARYRTDPDAIGDLLDDAHQQAKDSLVELRGLIRGLHPPVLSDRGLDAALPALSARCPVPVQLSTALDGRPSRAVEATGYFVVAEALTNIARHSGASSATVGVSGGRDSLYVRVSDDGRGGADPRAGSGLRGLADRVAGVDGQLALDSPPGGPTVLTVELPCR